MPRAIPSAALPTGAALAFGAWAAAIALALSLSGKGAAAAAPAALITARLVDVWHARALVGAVSSRRRFYCLLCPSRREIRARIRAWCLPPSDCSPVFCGWGIGNSSLRRWGRPSWRFLERCWPVWRWRCTIPPSRFRRAAWCAWRFSEFRCMYSSIRLTGPGGEA